MGFGINHVKTIIQKWGINVIYGSEQKWDRIPVRLIGFQFHVNPGVSRSSSLPSSTLDLIQFITHPSFLNLETYLWLCMSQQCFNKVFLC